MAEVKKRLKVKVEGQGGEKGKTKKVVTGSSKNPVTPDMVDTFVELVLLKGYSLTDAWVAVHPNTKGSRTANTKDAWKFAHRDDVKARTQEVKDEMRKKHEEFFDRLVGYHIEEIDRVYNEEHSLTNCMEQVKSLSRISGYEKKTIAVDAKVGAMDESSVEDKLAFLLAKKAK